MNKITYNLSELEWSLSGFTPYEWKLDVSAESLAKPQAEVSLLNVTVPGSVQKALYQNGILPDWNRGLNARLCEWVENRHWLYETKIPDNWLNKGKKFILNCLGLDYSGVIFLNDKQVYEFANSHRPHTVDISDRLVSSGNVLRIVFYCPPRWLGQFEYTSRIKEWKARFNYRWDWTQRLVQIGIWDDIFIEAVDEGEIEEILIYTDVDIEKSKGLLSIRARISAAEKSYLKVCLGKDGNTVLNQKIDLNECLGRDLKFDDLDIEFWWPNGMGHQYLYDLDITLCNNSGHVIDSVNRKIGFKKITWQRCEKSPKESPPWICVVNGRPVFLQGVNWTPIRPNFADVSKDDYEKRLNVYKDMGCNIFRVWGGGFLEKESFYELCDECGLMVWQEFPLSSSGLENYPPDDAKSIAELSEIAKSYIIRRQYHVSLIVWCGGNELCSEKYQGTPITQATPITLSHPLMLAFSDIVKEMDPTRRFVPSAPNGPAFGAEKENYGKGLHWVVNGPWKVIGTIEAAWADYWSSDDSLMRTETGAPGASPVDIIREFKGELQEFPASPDNPLWGMCAWWCEWEQFTAENGHDANNLEEYVLWSQKRQAQALHIAAKCSKERFPQCAGIIIWMGHDSFPCAANTSILDFHGNPKPSAQALKKVFRT